ncbi:hypothetical protein NM208_g9210 [Fusarium decemcellulare]|uniref:Uncharacterized protein n=1 Tax=Fusarium decemcellulare TaxID=57161 RepID=A0ACC1S2N3_9HYPO|nr:hypothetical protein NM208_g9210 [Fusarium decemcellulare]
MGRRSGTKGLISHGAAIANAIGDRNPQANLRRLPMMASPRSLPVHPPRTLAENRGGMSEFASALPKEEALQHTSSFLTPRDPSGLEQEDDLPILPGPVAPTPGFNQVAHGFQPMQPDGIPRSSSSDQFSGPMQPDGLAESARASATQHASALAQPQQSVSLFETNMSLADYEQHLMVLQEQDASQYAQGHSEGEQVSDANKSKQAPGTSNSSKHISKATSNTTSNPSPKAHSLPAKMCTTLHIRTICRKCKHVINIGCEDHECSIAQEYGSRNWCQKKSYSNNVDVNENQCPECIAKKKKEEEEKQAREGGGGWATV